jgi:hypothetical protein
METTAIASPGEETREVSFGGRFFFTLHKRRIILSPRNLTRRSWSRSNGRFNMEGTMKVPVTILSVVLAGAVFGAVPAGANQAAAEKKEAPAAKKGTRWQGHVVRIYKDLSQMDVRGGGTAHSEDLRKVAYDSSTQWTKQGKPGEQDEVKEGSFVIVLGKVDEKGILRATRIDLRLPR